MDEKLKCQSCIMLAISLIKARVSKQPAHNYKKSTSLCISHNSLHVALLRSSLSVRASFSSSLLLWMNLIGGACSSRRTTVPLKRGSPAAFHHSRPHHVSMRSLCKWSVKCTAHGMLPVSAYKSIVGYKESGSMPVSTASVLLLKLSLLSSGEAVTSGPL